MEEKIRQTNIVIADSFDEFWFEPTIEEVETILTYLESAPSVLSKDRVSYIFGEGKQPKKTYVEIEENGISVVWKGVRGPMWAKLLSLISSAYFGLIKVEKSTWIKSSMLKLSHLSAVTFYSFSITFEKKFTHEISTGNWRKCGINLVEDDDSYFMFTLDGDNEETKSGLLGILRVGRNCPNDLKAMVKNFGEYGYLGNNRL